MLGVISGMMVLLGIIIIVAYASGCRFGEREDE